MSTVGSASHKDRRRHRERTGRADALNRLWDAQEKWRWRLFVPAVVVGVGAIVMPRQWQSSPGTGLFYVAMMTCFSVLTYVWMKRWVAYWRAYHQFRGDTFWGARKAEVRAWWISHPWHGRVGFLVLVLITLNAYLWIRWPNSGVANTVLVLGLAAAMVTSRLTAK
jgi:hypothetical protein